MSGSCHLPSCPDKPQAREPRALQSHHSTCDEIHSLCNSFIGCTVWRKEILLWQMCWLVGWSWAPFPCWWCWAMHTMSNYCPLGYYHACPILLYTSVSLYLSRCDTSCTHHFLWCLLVHQQRILSKKSKDCSFCERLFIAAGFLVFLIPLVILREQLVTLASLRELVSLACVLK